MAESRSDSQTMQRAFDAQVQVSMADIGLYFVCAAGNTPEHGMQMRRSLRRVGAQTAARVSDIKVLAVMRITAFEQLRADRAIALIGPVSLDAERFQLFQRAVGMSEDDGSSPDNS